MATKDRRTVLHATAGIMVKPLDIAIASYCGTFELAELAMGPATLTRLRQVIVSHPDQMPRFISTGRLSPDTP